jgi:drug/metabolite transporter (DMT)-like permease
MPVKYLKIIPYITAFVLFMMVHDYLQEILQLQFSVANLVLPNVFTLFDCLGCVAGPLLYIYISSKQQIISATGQPPQPLSQKQHPFVHQLSLQKDHLRSVFLPLAILTTVGVGFANASLHLVNYPVKVTVKSFKLIPTMIIATYLLHKSYHITKYLSAGLLCLGLAIFLLSDQYTAEKPSSIMGIFFLIISCCVDSVTPVLQDKTMNELKSPPIFVMTLTNFIATVCMFILITITGELFIIIPYVAENPVILFFISFYGTSTFIGIFAYMCMVKEVGGVGTALVSTLRKVCTVVLSFILQGRPFSWGYAVGGLMIVVSLLLEKVFRKNNNSNSNNNSNNNNNNNNNKISAESDDDNDVHVTLIVKNENPQGDFVAKEVEIK